MKKRILLTFLVCIFSVLMATETKAATMNEKLKGKILIQVESHGEAWYVETGSGERHFLGRPVDAFNVMRKLGLGVSDADFLRMKGVAPLKLSGKILLKVQDKGQAYYVNPTNLKLHYLGRPADAFALMRSLGLGISNKNLGLIKISKFSTLIVTPSTAVTVPANPTTETKPVENIVTPKISSLKLENGSDLGFIDSGDIITIVFSEEINPKSINKDLEKGSFVNNVYYYSTGGVSVTTTGLVTIKNIASFDNGLLERNSEFPVKMALDFSGQTLTITLLGGNEVAITKESFSNAIQIGGTIKNTENNTMLASDITNLSGTFGGEYNENSGTPFVSSMKVINSGDEGFIDTGDAIMITFNEEIDPKSINQDLVAGSNVSNVAFSSTGGVGVSLVGKVVIKNIATFDMGSVKASGNFTSRLALNSTGKVLTITLTDGNDISITGENFNHTNQTGATIKDLDGRIMITALDIANPSGTFGGEQIDDSGNPYIKNIVVTNNGNEGYIDTSDTIVINFSETIDSATINEDLESGSYLSNIPHTMTGGVNVSSSGIVTINNILTFDMGSVVSGGTFLSKIALDAASDTLTITLTSGGALSITSEDFENAEQIGNTLKDNHGNLMLLDSDISNPTGTFGGVLASNSQGPDITAIKISNNGNSGYIDINDSIAITFSEAINPESVNMNLDKGSHVSSVSHLSTGGVSISSSGKVTIKDIASFDMGAVENSENFSVKVALNSTGKILTITLVSGENVAITNESFGLVTQIGGVIKNLGDSSMTSDSLSYAPSGTFGN